MAIMMPMELSSTSLMYETLLSIGRMFTIMCAKSFLQMDIGLAWMLTNGVLIMVLRFYYGG